MSRAIADLIKMTHEFYAHVQNGVAQSVQGGAQQSREFVEKNRTHIESTANAVFSSVASFFFAGKRPDELKAHLIRAFPTSLTANEAGAIARKYASHFDAPMQEVIGQAMSNTTALSLSIDQIADDHRAFSRTYGLTWLATQPFRWTTHTSVDGLIGFLQLVDDVAEKYRSRR